MDVNLSTEQNDYFWAFSWKETAHHHTCSGSGQKKHEDILQTAVYIRIHSYLKRMDPFWRSDFIHIFKIVLIFLK